MRQISFKYNTFFKMGGYALPRPFRSDLADRRQRGGHKRRLTPVTLTNTIYITRPATSIGASIKAVLLIDLLAAALPRADHTDQQD